jgi:predicted Zn-dependent peptidase
VGEILHEIAGMVSRPPDAPEIKLARGQVTQTLAELFATNDAAVGALRQIVLQHLPLDHFSTWPGRLERLTAKDVLAAAKRYLEGATTVVVVGPPTLGEALEKAGLGPIERLKIETLGR